MWDPGVRCGEGVGSGDGVGHAELSGDVGVFYEREVRGWGAKGFKGWAMGERRVMNGCCVQRPCVQ